MVASATPTRNLDDEIPVEPADHQPAAFRCKRVRKWSSVNRSSSTAAGLADGGRVRLVTTGSTMSSVESAPRDGFERGTAVLQPAIRWRAVVARSRVVTYRFLFATRDR